MGTDAFQDMYLKLEKEEREKVVRLANGSRQAMERYILEAYYNEKQFKCM